VEERYKTCPCRVCQKDLAVVERHHLEYCIKLHKIGKNFKSQMHDACNGATQQTSTNAVATTVAITETEPEQVTPPHYCCNRYCH
jgi:hypothetical protein